jgi:uncharacterized membrane protein
MSPVSTHFVPATRSLRTAVTQISCRWPLFNSSDLCPRVLSTLCFRFIFASVGLGGADQKRKQEMTNFTRVKAWVLVQESDVEAKMAHCVHCCCVAMVIVILVEYVTSNYHASRCSLVVVYVATCQSSLPRGKSISLTKSKTSSRSQIPTHHLTYAAWKSKLHA